MSVPETSTPANSHDGRSDGGEAMTMAMAGWPAMALGGVVAAVLGALVLVWPGVSLVVVGVLFGAYLLVSGIFQLVGAFGPHVPVQLRAFGFISGAFGLLLGLICFRSPAQSILLLALWIGFGLLLRGITSAAMALSHRETPARGWYVAVGAITALAGIVLISSPFGSILALTMVSGIWLVVLGVLEVAHSVMLRAAMRRRGRSGAARG